MISIAWAQRLLNGIACAEGEHLHWGRKVFASLGTGSLLSAAPCPYSEAMTMVSALCRIWPEPASSIPFLSVLLPLTSFQPHGLLPISRTSSLVPPRGLCINHSSYLESSFPSYPCGSVWIIPSPPFDLFRGHLLQEACSDFPC